MTANIRSLTVFVITYLQTPITLPSNALRWTVKPTSLFGTTQFTSTVLLTLLQGLTKLPTSLCLADGAHDNANVRR